MMATPTPTITVEELTNDMDEQEIVQLLTDSTWQGQWDTVVEIYRLFPWTHIQKINNTSGDTALHAAADSGQETIADQLVKIILDYEGEPQWVTAGRAESSHQEQRQPDVVNEIRTRRCEKFREKLDKRAEAKALTIKNENRDTPLHLAASKGFVKICKSIVGIKSSEELKKLQEDRLESIARQYLLREKNNEGETPLFLAALNWHKEAFAYLNDMSVGYIGPRGAELTRKNKDTILHCAIKRELFDLAVIIIYYYYGLCFVTNEDGFTPLALLATRPSAFRSSTILSSWNQILYYCIPVKPLDVESAMKKMRFPEYSKAMNFPANYDTCIDIVSTLATGLKGLIKMMIPKSMWHLMGMDKNEPGDTENPEDEGNELGDFPPNYATWVDLLTFAYVYVLGLSGVAIKNIEKMKKKHVRSVQILHELMKEPSKSYKGEDASILPLDKLPKRPAQSSRKEASGQRPSQVPTEWHKAAEEDDKATLLANLTYTEGSGDTSKSLEILDCEKNVTEKKETALLVAAKNGIVEIVNEILDTLPVTIQERNSEKKNVLLVAVENRQPLVVKALKTHSLWDNLMLGMDDEENTVLHLAAEAIDEKKPWKIPGAAMQMIWDIKWYEYIKSLAPRHFHFRNNKFDKTPGEIFNSSHKELVKDSSEWLKDTSESCSVVAALIAGVSFATSSTVPGGTDSETGKPALEGQPAFDLFAMTSLVSLCFSVTALIMFLSILTSRKHAKDFRRDLPMKLLLGLSSLFVSIASMFVSFCAGHFFVLRENLKNTIFPIYAATCLPVSFYAVAQFPLYMDLLRAVFAKVPRPSDKGDDL